MEPLSARDIGVPGASYLRLSSRGFILCRFFHRWPLVPWSEVGKFRVSGSFVVVDLDERLLKRSKWVKINLVVGGVTDALPAIFGMSAEELAKLMNDYRCRAIAT